MFHTYLIFLLCINATRKSDFTIRARGFTSHNIRDVQAHPRGDRPFAELLCLSTYTHCHQQGKEQCKLLHNLLLITFIFKHMVVNLIFFNNSSIVKFFLTNFLQRIISYNIPFDSIYIKGITINWPKSSRHRAR